MKPAVVAAALALGLFVGFAVGRAWPGRLPEAPVRAVGGSAAAAAEEKAAAREEEIVRLRRELDQARRAPAAAPGPGERAPAPAAARDPRRHAEDIFEQFRRAFQQKGGPEFIRAIGMIDELDESMAPLFIEKLRAGIDVPELKNITPMLILLSGGNDAAAWVQEQLANPALSDAERKELLKNLSGTGVPVLRKLPIDGPLGRTMEGLLLSEDPAERMGGAGLLGGRDSDAARVQLRSMATADPDGQVRASALESLGWVGDRSTLEFLRAYPKPDPTAPHQWAVTQALERAIQQLERKFGN